MSDIELTIWAAMMGALTTLLGAALADAYRAGGLAAWRGVGFIAITGVSSMILSGLPEHLAGITDASVLMPAKVAMGPLTGALTVLYLGIWYGAVVQDRFLENLIQWGSLIQCLAALGLLLTALLYPESGRQILKIAFALNLLSVCIGVVCSVRGVQLGDALARYMVLACMFLCAMVVGLYSKSLGFFSSPWVWALTASLTVTYLLITTVLTLQRNRQLRLISKIASGVAKTDEITGLPVGGTLLSKIDDALWRSMRMERECVVMAIWIDNLYVFNNELDASIEHEIRHVLAARIRRAIGFRHTLGLQQARCFVAAISAVNDRERLIAKMRALVPHLQRTLQVGILLGKAQAYTPNISIGLVFVGLGHMADTLHAIDQAQSLAKQAMREDAKLISQEAHPTSYGVSSKLPQAQQPT